jgi:hypothetical protein
MEGQGALVSAQGRVAWRVMSRSVIADRCRGFRASSRALAREIDAEPGAGRSTSRIAAANCRSARHVLSSARLDVLPARSWRGDGPTPRRGGRIYLGDADSWRGRLPGETPSAPMLVVLVGPNGSIVRGSGGLPRPGLLVGVLADPIAWP